MDRPLRAEERILQATLGRIAVEGLGAPLRTVARDAGVSAGLIIHHFGSREKLLEACDRRALEVIREQKRSAIAGGAATMLAQLATAEQYASEVGYILRRLQAGGPLAQRLIEEFIADAAVYLQEGVEAGLISRSRDPEARVRVLVQMALGSLVLQLPGQGARMDLEDLPRWMRRYTDSLVAPMLELYTTPLLTDPAFLDSAPAPEGGAAEHLAPPSDRSTP